MTSFGTTYNMTDEEYRESVRLGFYWRDRSGIPRDEETTRFLAYVLRDHENFRHPTYHRIRELPDGIVLKKDVDDNIFTDGTIDALITAMGRNRQRVAQASEILAELKAAYLDDRRSPVQRLADRIDEYQKIKAENLGTSRQALGGDFEHLVERGERGGVDPVSPWVSSLVTGGGASAEEGRAGELLLRPLEHRAIYLVYRIFNPNRSA